MLVDVVRIQGTRLAERQGSFDCAAACFARVGFAQDDMELRVGVVDRKNRDQNRSRLVLAGCPDKSEVLKIEVSK